MRRVPVDIDPTGVGFKTFVFTVRDPENHPDLCGDLGGDSTDLYAISEVLLRRVQQAAGCAEGDAAKRVVFAVSRDSMYVVEGASETEFAQRWVVSSPAGGGAICGALVVSADEANVYPSLLRKAEERVRAEWRRELRRAWA